ncbi:unnamed protein product [Trichogramma brassicae]|uniref:Uncharacterized protein n=1 Tax=Trichogramma brassicae TaxID=86971 RepID=A0A6H5IF50_9HYME|nr:unnamed protein product [Trichogramma brassicae]
MEFGPEGVNVLYPRQCQTDGKRSRSRSGDVSSGSQEEATRENKKVRRSSPKDMNSPNMINVKTDPCPTREEVPTEKHEKLQACLGGLSKIISTVSTYDEKKRDLCIVRDLRQGKRGLREDIKPLPTVLLVRDSSKKATTHAQKTATSDMRNLPYQPWVRLRVEIVGSKHEEICRLDRRTPHRQHASKSTASTSRTNRLVESTLGRGATACRACKLNDYNLGDASSYLWRKNPIN